jgi:peptidoglycan hydrolase-like protein with peptidoglycan-binding domain
MAIPNKQTALRRGLTGALSVLTAAVAIGAILVAPTLASADPAGVMAPATTTADIKHVQTNLNGLGYNAGSVDGVAGTQTKSATSAFQSDRCLQVDGVIGPLTIGALDGVVKEVQTKVSVTAGGTYDAATTTAVKTYQTANGLTSNGLANAATMTKMGIVRQVASCHQPIDPAHIVAIAKAEVGTLEGSGNCVPGKPYGTLCASWCAEFSTWVWQTGGVNIPRIAYVPSVQDWGVAHGKWTTTLTAAEPGDQIIFGSAGNRYHIGIVDNVDGARVNVISGNTPSPSGGNEGVWEKNYPLSTSQFYGLVKLK